MDLIVPIYSLSFEQKSIDMAEINHELLTIGLSNSYIDELLIK